ncbi:MAG: hypothetical protein CMP36_01940 [Rickettsiales bacterium]|nr:hypothetical protein [Rickettsiales bacterium]OUV81296.1 MAG: hypothetical protein CBC91_02440 [Rickettsiales bacterium TMED131]|tara:strand:- start:1678 stop:2061 length:384 start_codon:yes stop_codon:yes gene_type:complete
MILIKAIFFIKFFLFFNLGFTNQTEVNLENKMRELSSELRCLVCQNQSLLDSDSDLAKDLKEIIYEKLENGESKQEIKEYLVKRYGEFILFKPLFNEVNLLLWLAPMLSFVIIGVVGFRKIIIKKKK